MTDSTATPDDRRDIEDAPPASQRPIPDGGLGPAMPDWMRQTPSWKRPVEPAAMRTMPPADSSTIDPRQLIDLDDLPQWLQDVASRGSRSVGQPALAGPIEPLPENLHVDDTAARPAVPALPGTERPRTGPGAWLPVPGIETPAGRSDHVRLTPSPLHAEPPWWMSDAIIAFLFVAIVLTLIYVILAATGVL